MPMKSIYEIRRENLKALIKTWGGPTSMARKLGHSNGSYLAQIAGPHPRREISEKVAREIEGILGLPLGYLDKPHERAPGKAQNGDITQCVRMVATVLRDVGLRPTPEVTANLVQLVYDRLQLTGALDEQYTKQLVELVKK
jgi:hypothetical protein